MQGRLLGLDHRSNVFCKKIRGKAGPLIRMQLVTLLRGRNLAETLRCTAGFIIQIKNHERNLFHFMVLALEREASAVETLSKIRTRSHETDRCFSVAGSARDLAMDMYQDDSRCLGYLVNLTKIVPNDYTLDCHAYSHFSLVQLQALTQVRLKALCRVDKRNAKMRMKLWHLRFKLQ